MVLLLDLTKIHQKKIHQAKTKKGAQTLKYAAFVTRGSGSRAKSSSDLGCDWTLEMLAEGTEGDAATLLSLSSNRGEEDCCWTKTEVCDCRAGSLLIISRRV